MGDRVLFQVVGDPDPTNPKRKGPTFSPVAYGHWSGSRVKDILTRLEKRMQEGVPPYGPRKGDVDYTFARLLQEMMQGDLGNLSFGAWNTSRILTAKDSQGDAGVIIVDVRNGGFEVRCLDSYWDSPDGTVNDLRPPFKVSP